MDEQEFASLRQRYRTAFEACGGLFAKSDDQLSDDDLKTLEVLEQARRDLLTALWSRYRDDVN